jgi:ceramide glucosyltransferase
MAAVARYPLLAISDSDARVSPAVLRRVAPHFNDAGVGAVTCLYRGVPANPARTADRLGALYANGWTLPSNVVAGRLGGLESCDGPMTLIRREVIEAEGGFERLSHILGDDHELGAMTVRQGLRVLQGPVVETTFDEPSVGALLSHELRWARTTRAATPVAYAASVVTWSLPLTVLLLATVSPMAAAAGGAAQIALRMALIALTRARLRTADGTAMPAPWTVAARECLCFAVWLGGWFGRRVSWRGATFTFGRGGVLIPLEMAGAGPAAMRRIA